ncbi:hypothetical protein [Pelobacter propionicus]|uniref:Uncharacterized protein n=1 Tax=Pelobacter propionicus (strain DSM 2379 / NBRC 103807 / OttBd1) TaxID=338966 RepID=A1AU25_PELPD|nr:hypothetical protein [Pelobacter propionicus]ABL00846.1 conserved hypothetical protein [Pelobacter propionicus DSM 2379]
MVDLLLITDIPRLRQLFMRLADDPNLRLRVASSLEQGGEEIAADKPAMVFVQTHVSGLSADILLMHLKKRLGRRRTRFVLLAPPDQVNDAVLKLYHSSLDTSQDDFQLLNAVHDAIATLAVKGKKRAAAVAEPADAAPVADAVPQAPKEPALQEPLAVDRVDFQISPSAFSPQYAESLSAAAAEPAEPPPVEQGSAYAARPRLSVYSEFTSSLENAVSDARPTELPRELPAEQPSLRDSRQDDAIGIETRPPRPRYARFLLWFVPLVVVVLAVTLLQHRGSQPKVVDVAPLAPALPGEAAKAPAPATKQPMAGADASAAARAHVSSIDQAKGQAPPPFVAPRLTTLPSFVPRDGLDKKYGAANPGWERYMGLVTEFKVFREGTAIKAIQVIDKGGRGIPEGFMKSALAQLAGNSPFVQDSSEKRDGYQIQRGRLAANLNAVFYRDAQGGGLRAFVVTWQ